MFSNTLKTFFVTSALFSSTKKVAHASDNIRKNIFYDEGGNNKISSGTIIDRKKKSVMKRLISRRKKECNNNTNPVNLLVKKYENDWCPAEDCRINKTYIFVQPFADSLESNEFNLQKKLENYLVDYLINYHDSHGKVDQVF